MRCSSFVVVGLCVLASLPGLAQGLGEARTGQVMLNAQAAAVDDATALLVNPAGLAWIDGLELQSGWQTRVGTDFDHIGDAEVVFGGPVVIAGGLGLELPSSQTPRLRASLAGAFAFDDAFSVGLALHRFQPAGPGFADASADLGLQLRPAGFLALGLVGENLGGKAGASLRGGMSLRPFGDVLTVGLDGRLRPGAGNIALPNGSFEPGVSARVHVGGVIVGAGAVVQNLGPAAAQPLAVEAMASLELDLEHFGVSAFGGAGGLGSNAQQGVVGVRSRASTTAWASLLPSSGRWISLDLTDDGVPPAEDGLLASLFSDSPSATWILAALDNVADDSSIEGVVLRLQGLSFGWGRAAELRAAILRLRENGKKVVVHMGTGDDVDVYVASAADRVWLTPSGGLGLDGLRARKIYIGSALARLGVKAEAVSAGRYKSAPRMFTHDEPSPEELEVEAALLDGVYTTLTSAIAAGRSIPVDEVKAIIDLGGLSGPEALEKKIVDDLVYPDQVEARLASFAGRPGDSIFVEGGWLSAVSKDNDWSSPPTIALIPITGNIQMGKSGGGGLLGGGDSAGADDVVDAINGAAEDASVSAIVLRIDSPGGDAFASDLMYRAVMMARTKKPVIATMGDVAASGGYYVAAAADDIFVEDDTITGSIGVFGLLFSAGQLAADFGVKSYEVSRGARPGPDLFRGITDEERVRLQDSVDKTYEQFLDAVVAGRTTKPAADDGTLDPGGPTVRITKEELRALAEGRVWTGAEAKAKKLVDRTGSIIDAIKLARERAGISVDDEIALTVITGREGRLPALGSLGGMMAGLLGVAPSAGLSAAMRVLLGDPETAAFVLENEGRPLLLAPGIDLR